MLLALAAAMRLVGCTLHTMPGRDGVAYLWMAERWAAGDFGELFAHVFHPLYPFAVGVVLMLVPGLDAVAAGQLVAAGCSALAVVPLWYATARLFGQAAATWAAVMLAIGSWFVRHPAECMSEGPFQLLAASWAALLLGGTARPFGAGLVAGAAFLVRPEGGALALAGMLLLAARDSKRCALAHGAAAAAIALLLPLGSLATGHGFVLTPKAAFNWEVGAGGAESGIAHYLYHLLRLPGDAWEGLGYVVFPLMVAGVVRWRPRSLAAPELALLLPFVLQCAAIPLLRSNHRFVSGLGVLLLPFAGALFALLLQRVRWRWLLVLLLLASEAKLWWRRPLPDFGLGQPADRTIERELGRWLGGSMAATETLTSDMPRVWYFAGRRPPPPRQITPEVLLRDAGEPACRFVALRRGRSDRALDELARAGFIALELPAELRAVPGADEVVLRQRPR